MAAVRVRAASTGDMGIFDKFDCPKWCEKKQSGHEMLKKCLDSENSYNRKLRFVPTIHSI